MRSYSNKLCNPTPFPVKFKWDRGINITIDPFGVTELTIAQVDDFRGDKAGSEEVKELTDHFGIFLLDPNESFDRQALESIKASIKVKNEIYTSAINRARDRRGAQGYAPDENALQEYMKQMGFDILHREIELLREQEKYFVEKVKDIPTRSTALDLDPERTIFVMDPPKEFPTVSMMEFFLSMPENEGLKAKHKAYTSALRGETNAESN